MKPELDESLSQFHDPIVDGAKEEEAKRAIPPLSGTINSRRARMNKLFRVTPSGLAIGYIALGVLALAILAIPLWYVWEVNLSTLKVYVEDRDVQGLVHAFDREGAPGLSAAIDARAGSLSRDEILILADGSKHRLAGNLPAWPAEVPDAPGTYGLGISLGDGSSMRVVATHVALPDGHRLLTGRESIRFQSLVDLFWYDIAGATVLVLVLGVVAGWLIRRALLLEVQEVSRTAAAIAGGDYSRRVPTHGRLDALGTLARTVNGMLDQLASQNVRLEDAHDDLEGLVAQRTAQLAQANESLECALREMQEQKAQLDDLFELSPDAIVLTALDNPRNLRINKEFTRMFGFTAEEALGRRLRDLIAPDELEPANLTRDPDLLAGRTVEREVIRQRKDGTRFHSHITAKRVRLPDTEDAAYIIYRDITEAKLAADALRESEARFRNLTEISSDFFWETDAEHRYSSIEFGEAYVGIRDLSFKLGMEIASPSPDEAGWAAHRAVLAAHQRLLDFGFSRMENGKERFYEISGEPRFDARGGFLGYRGVGRDVTERKRAELALRKSEDRYARAMEASGDGHADWNIETGEFYVSPRYVEICGLPRDTTFRDRAEWVRAFPFHPEDRAKWEAAVAAHFAGRGTRFREEMRIVVRGETRWLEVTYVCRRDAAGRPIRWTSSCSDITAFRRAEAILAGEKRILEMVTRGDSLPRILESLCELVEEQAEGVLASVLLAQNGRLVHGGAPSLPKAYVDAIDGGAIGPSAGSCGTAAHRGEQVIVSDIATDPLWVDYREAALSFSLRACWSTPIFSSEGNVIGTFAMYYREPRSPSAYEQEIIEQITHLAGVAIQRKVGEEKLRRSQHYLAEAQKVSHTGSWAWSPVSNTILYWSEECYRILDYDPAQGLPSFESTFERIHPEDRPDLAETIERAVREKADFQIEYRLVLPDGTRRNVRILSQPVLDASGKLVEFVGTVMDVTEQKRAKQERRAHLWFLESMDRINRAMQRSNDVELMTSGVMQEALEIFACDRACLTYPCDPDTPTYRTVMEHTNPEYAGVLTLGQDLPVTPEWAEVLRRALRHPDAVVDPSLPAGRHERFGTASLLAIAVRPKGDRPYLFVVHSARSRPWTGAELRLFEETARRLGEALTSVLAHRNLLASQGELRRSQHYLAEGQNLSHTGSWAWNPISNTILYWSTESYRIFGCDPAHGLPSAESVIERYHPEDLAAVLETVDRAVREKVGFQLEHRLILPGGVVRNLRCLADTVLNASGELIEYIGTVMDVTEQKRAEEERRTHLWFLECMDRVNRAMQRTNDVEGMMSGVLEETLAIFGCDRAWLVYPCDPDAATSRVMMERTRPEYPGAFALGEEFPVNMQQAELLRRVLEGPGAATDLCVPPEIRERFSIQSIIAIAVRPKGDRPYLFGLHQCSHARAWTAAERRLFEEMARRLEDALTSVLAHRNLLASEERYAHAMEGSDAGHWDWNIVTDEMFLSERARQMLVLPDGPLPRTRTAVMALAPQHPDDVVSWDQHIDDGIAKGRYEREYRVMPKPGEVRWIRARAKVYKDAHGAALRMTGSLADITEAKLAEDALRASEERYSLALDATEEGHFDVNIDTDEVLTSAPLNEIYGFPPGTRLVKRSECLKGFPFYGNDAEIYHAEIRAAEAKGGPERYEFEYRILRSSGEVRWLRTRGKVTRDAEGRAHRRTGVVADITEQKRAEEERREHLWFLESMDRINRAMQRSNELELMMSGVLEETLAIFGSDRARLVYPCDPDAAISRVVMEHSRPEYPGAFALGEEVPMDRYAAEFVRRVLDSPGAATVLSNPLEMRQRFRIQSAIAIAVRPKGDRPYLFGLHQCSHARTWTAAERRLFEEIARRLEDTLTSVLSHRKLLEREAEVRRLVDANIVGIVFWDLDGGIRDANDAFLRIAGYERADLVSAPLRWTDLTPAEWRERDERAIAELNSTGSFQPFEKEYFRKDGSRVPVLIGGALFQAGGKEGVAFVVDLSEQKRAEEALRSSEAYLAEAQTLSQTGSWAWSPDQDIRYWSEECYRVLSFDPQDGLPRFEQFFQRIHPDDQPGFRELVQTATREKAEWKADYRIVHPGGVVRDVHVVAHPVLSTSGHLVEFVGTVIDVTEPKRAEQELRTSELERARAEQALRDAREKLAQASKIASLAELSASIAHEINQPLQAIVANGHASLRWLDAKPPNIEKAIRTATRVVRDGNAAAEVVSRIRALFDRAAPAKVDLDINKLILQVRTLMADEIQGNGVALETELGEDVPTIRADAVQIQQVIVNLVRNAVEAMAGARSKPLLIRSRRSASHVAVDVRDQGRGLVDPEKIFEPFVSTKETGMGMGLTICRSIVEAHAGNIRVIHNEGPGVTFSFSLPIEASDAT